MVLKRQYFKERGICDKYHITEFLYKYSGKYTITLVNWNKGAYARRHKGAYARRPYQMTI